MTELEYSRKRDLYTTSDAPAHIIDAAVKALDAEWQAHAPITDRAQALASSLVEVGEIDDID
jgi:hypothetical protein